MWLITNRTPYAAEGSWVQDKDANKIWLVAVKATFDIGPDGATTLAEEQVPVLRMPQPLGAPGLSSSVYDADLLGVKPGTDVLVNGRAWAPDGGTARSVDAGLAVGPIRKIIRVVGDRRWEGGVAGVSPSAPEPFESMPITWERAFGGWDRSQPDAALHRLEDRNPVGTGFSAYRDNCDGLPLPNVERPDQLIRSWRDRPEPVGLNVVDCAWSPRRELAGTYDDAWRKNRFPLWAADFDPRYALCAPTDQQVPGFLRGGEDVHLMNLSPSGRIVFRLPRLYPFFRTRFGSDVVEHRGQLSTVIVEPDLPRVIMVWQSALTCNDRVDELDETVVTEKRMVGGRA